MEKAGSAAKCGPVRNLACLHVTSFRISRRYKYRQECQEAAARSCKLLWNTVNLILWHLRAAIMQIKSTYSNAITANSVEDLIQSNIIYITNDRKLFTSQCLIQSMSLQGQCPSTSVHVNTASLSYLSTHNKAFLGEIWMCYTHINHKGKETST